MAFPLFPTIRVYILSCVIFLPVLHVFELSEAKNCASHMLQCIEIDL